MVASFIDTRNSNIHSSSQRCNESPMLFLIPVPDSFVTDVGTKDFARVRMPSAETWQKSLQSDQPQSGCKRMVAEGEMNNDDPCSSNFPRSNCQMSTYSDMPRSSKPMFVYQRRKPQGNSTAMPSAQTCTNTKISDMSHSVISSEAHSMATKKHTIRDIDSKAESSSGCPFKEGPCSEEILRNDNPGALDTCCIIDSCSSSKSNMDPNSAPLKTDVEDLGECSSSGALAAERLQDEMLERAVNISIMYSRRRRGKVPPISVRDSAEDAGVSRDNSRSRSCKVCKHSEKTLKMIVCDKCNHAFHLSCCRPLLKEIPEDEWFCDSCVKKKYKKLKEKSTSLSLNISSETDRYRDSVSEIGRISIMLRETEPSTSKIRIGREFQAEVPGWSGPIIDEVYRGGEPLEISLADGVHDWNCKRSPRISSIGNWIQCREVVGGTGEGDDEIICGKWRRAPVFEVQTDNWECFRCVLWDPCYADCAVPQELDTDEVLKQLKYMEMLRPRLAAKRRKVDRTKRVGSQGLPEA